MYYIQSRYVSNTCARWALMSRATYENLSDMP